MSRSTAGSQFLELGNIFYSRTFVYMQILYGLSCRLLLLVFPFHLPGYALCYIGM